MKNYRHCSVLVPCHSLEDFPTHYRGQDAENLLACWTAIWHPALIATTNQPPRWLRAGIDNIEVDNSLVVVPIVANHYVNDSFLENARQQQTILIHDPHHTRLQRQAIIEAAIDQNAPAKSANEKIDPDLAADFLALGYGYLQVQLMTRQLRYSSNLNEATFFQHLVAAAVAAAAGRTETGIRDLITCFDLLMEEKNNYYPVQPELMDLVLVADTTLRKSLTQQLTATHPMNFSMTGTSATKLTTENPTAVDRIRQDIENERATIVGGAESELADPLLSIETTVRQIQTGIQSAETVFGVPPPVFMRQRFGLSPLLPGILGQFDFVGAIHATLEDRQADSHSIANLRWTGIDGQSIPTFGLPVVDAEDSAAMLRFGLEIGEQIDTTHTATFLFAHWPSHLCDSYRDLVRIQAHSRLFGRFVTCEDYFNTVYDPGYGETFNNTDEYRPPYLNQAVVARQLNPLSRYVDYWNCHYRLHCSRNLLVQLGLAFRLSKSINQTLDPVIDWQSTLTQIQGLELKLDRTLESGDPTELPDLMETIDLMIRELNSQFPSFDRQPTESNPIQFCTINTTNTTCRQRIATPSSQMTARRNNCGVVIADTGDRQTDWVVEIAGTGRVHFPSVSAPGKTSTDPLRNDPTVLQGHRLQNEYFQLIVDETTGGIRSLQTHGPRQNLIGQQLAVRIPDRGNHGWQLSRARYSTMVVEEIKSHTSSRIDGSITSYGRLVDEEITLAKFQQTVRVCRGIPLAELDIEIDLLSEIDANINGYVCSRLAWKDESSVVVSSFQETRCPISTDWFMAPNFIEIQHSNHTVTMLTGGLPHHRRVSRRMIDSLLIVGSERRRQFRLALGIDLRYPTMAATQWGTPAICFAATKRQPRDSQLPDWWFHFDCKNILVTWWEPLFDGNDRIGGVQLRLKETEGRGGKLTITSPLPLHSAKRVNFKGDFLRSLEINSAQADRTVIEFSGNEFFQLTLDFQSSRP